jgi:hypothetical protein
MVLTLALFAIPHVASAQPIATKNSPAAEEKLEELHRNGELMKLLAQQREALIEKMKQMQDQQKRAAPS